MVWSRILLILTTVDQQLQLMKIILQAEMDQHDNNITYKIMIQANITNLVATLMVPIERIVIQCIWLKSGSNWINATHNDDVKYMITFESGRLYGVKSYTQGLLETACLL